MTLSYLAPLLDVIGAVLTVLGVLATTLGTVWVFFRKKIDHWWKPYRTGIDAMSDIPGIRMAVEKVHRDTEHVRAGMVLLTLTMRARADTNVDAGEYEASNDGAITVVNSTFARWLGVGKADILGFRWVNFVHPADIERFRAEWQRCTMEHRTFRQRLRLVDVQGDEFEADFLVTPIPDAPPASHWIGVVRKVNAP